MSNTTPVKVAGEGNAPRVRFEYRAITQSEKGELAALLEVGKNRQLTEPEIQRRKELDKKRETFIEGPDAFEKFIFYSNGEISGKNVELIRVLSPGRYVGYSASNLRKDGQPNLIKKFGMYRIYDYAYKSQWSDRYETPHYVTFNAAREEKANEIRARINALSDELKKAGEALLDVYKAEEVK